MTRAYDDSSPSSYVTASVPNEVCHEQADPDASIHNRIVYTDGGALGPVTRDVDENCDILVVIDCFTRFIELYPVSDTSALPCARALLGYVCRYGTPMTIRSDRGTQFVNGIIKELLELLQVEHEVSLAYSKEPNAIVERANREVMRHLTAIVSISESMTHGLRISSRWYNAS